MMGFKRIIPKTKEVVRSVTTFEKAQNSWIITLLF